MTFTLTEDFIRSLATPAKEGDLMPWIGSCDENVKWRIGASEEVGKGRAGVYVSRTRMLGYESVGAEADSGRVERLQNIAGWKEHLAPKIETCLGKNGLKVDVQTINASLC